MMQIRVEQRTDVSVENKSRALPQSLAPVVVTEPSFLAEPNTVSSEALSSVHNLTLQLAVASALLNSRGR